MKKQPLLSIVIATKNRVQYCIAAIETTLAIPDDEIELVIQDNTDDKTLEQYIQQREKDNRLVYRYTPPPFSSIDNFNAAMELATGEYVCLIGDDDAVLPEILTMTRWAKKNNVDSLCPKVFVSYLWPQTLPRYPEGFFTIPDYSNKFYEVFPVEMVKRFLLNGAINYLSMGMPKVYHGIVKKKCMDMVKQQTGHYFGGLSPDIYAAISLSFVVQKHLLLDRPLSIAGICPKCTSVDSISGGHVGKYEDIPHLRDRGGYVWDNLIPRFYSTQTIWAETAIKTIKEMNKEYMLKYFGVYKFIGCVYLCNQTIKNVMDKILIEYRKDNKISKLLFCFAILRASIFVVFNRYVERIKYRFHYKRENILDIKICVNEVMKKLKKIEIV